MSSFHQFYVCCEIQFPHNVTWMEIGELVWIVEYAVVQNSSFYCLCKAERIKCKAYVTWVLGTPDQFQYLPPSVKMRSPSLPLATSNLWSLLFLHQRNHSQCRLPLYTFKLVEGSQPRKSTIYLFPQILPYPLSSPSSSPFDLIQGKAMCL